MATTPLTETWALSHAATMFLLKHIPEDALSHSYAPRTRSVGKQFAHLHNVRLLWLESSAPKHLDGLKKFGKDDNPSHSELTRGLIDSAKATDAWIAESEAAGKVKNWKKSPASFVGYMVAHEAHHRALAIVALRAGGIKLPDEVIFGLWEWGK